MNPAAAGLPDHVKRYLIAAGWMDGETGATRNARRTRCEQCRQIVWRGLNADRMSMATDCDPSPLGGLGEALARFSGWRTFSLRFMGARYLIDIRDQFAILGEPPGSQRNCDVLAEHRCGISTDHLPKGISRIEPLISATELPIDPPF